jgi:hypothetical protein
MIPAVRANPAYRFHGWNTLPEALRDALRVSIVDANVAGVLVSTPGSPLPDKVVGPEGAELFARLQAPAAAADIDPGIMMHLVLDGVLEIQTADEGFASGPAAFERLPQSQIIPAPVNRLSQLSLAALEYAARLPLRGVSELAGRLYGYHRMPLTARWTHVYPGPAAVLDLVRSTDISDRWELPAGTTAHADWLSWSRGGGRGGGGRLSLVDQRSQPYTLPYKLYVSPHIEALPEVMPAFVNALGDTDARHFKVGANAAGLLRPDKLVVYLRDVHELEDVADCLANALAGVRPHGVPFSAEIAGDGLLSWGGDPAPDSGPVGGGRESWRLSICRRLAEHLIAAKAVPSRRIEPAQYALARLASDGVRLPDFAPATLAAPSLSTPRIPAPRIPAAQIPAPWT